MRTPILRRCIPFAALGLVTLGACGDDATPDAGTTALATTTTPAVTTVVTVATTTTVAGEITVTVGVDSSPDRVVQVKVGQAITLRITNPASDDEFHVHGVDLGDGENVAKGQTKTFKFTLTTPQRIEVESHATEGVLLIIEAVA